MKAVSSGLAAALLKKSRQPYVQVMVDNRRNAGTSPTVWGAWCTTPKADVGHCACVGVGNYVVDLRLDTVSGDVYGRRTHITATPDDFWGRVAPSAWTSAQIAACSDGSRAWLFWVDADRHTVKGKVSADGGLNWGAAFTVADFGTGHQVNSLAAVAPGAVTGSPAHEVILLAVDSPTGDLVTQDKVVHLLYRSGGGWSSAGSWGRAPGRAALGLAAVPYDCDGSHSEVIFVAAGKFEVLSGYNLQAYHLSLTAGGAATFTYAGCAKQLSGETRIAWPSMVVETELDRARVFFQYYDPALPAASRWQSYQMFIGQLVTADTLYFGPFEAFRVSGEQVTMGAARCGPYLVAGLADNLWKAATYDGTSRYLVNVSSRVAAFEHHVFDNALIEDMTMQPGFAYVLLDNSDGRLLNYGQPGADFEAIQRGAQVVITAGYRTDSGVEVEVLPPMWIERIWNGRNPWSGAAQDVPHLAIGGGPLLGGQWVLLKCYDAWALTARRGPTPNTYISSAAPRAILAEVFMQMGIYYSDDGTDRLSKPGAYPAVTWTTPAGTPWFNMIRDILLYCHCRCKFVMDYDKVNGGRPAARAYVFADRDVDPVDLAVGGSGELGLYAGLYWEQDRWGGYQYQWYEPAFEPRTILMAGAFTGALVEGKGVVDQEIDFDRVEAMGYWLPRPVVDYQVTASTYITAEQRAAGAAQEPLYCGQVLIPLHPCLELWDRVQVTDAGACQAVQKRFVVAIESYYDARSRRGRYDQVVTLMRHVRG